MEKMDFIFLRSIHKLFMQDVFLSKSNIKMAEEIQFMKALFRKYFITLVLYCAEIKM